MSYKTMKISKILVLPVAAGLLLGITGCEKKEATVQDDAKAAATDAGDALKQTAAAVKESGTKAVNEVTEKAKEVAAPASAKAQELIDAAKKLVNEGKFQEALAKLKDIGSEKLSVQQQSLVDGLKAQIEKALGASSKAATDATGAAGGLFKK